MSITDDGWLTFAQRVPGPANKVYAQQNAVRGMALHSAEGWYAGSLAELQKADRQASWCLFLKLTGDLVQHYPITASCWAGGNVAANTTLVSLELEGKAGTAINAEQIATLRRVVDTIGKHAGWTPSRKLPVRTLWEHREVWDWASPNAGPTACPSGRYDPFYAALEAPQMPDNTDAVLRQAMADREALRYLASNPDHLLVGRAVAELRASGYPL